MTDNPLLTPDLVVFARWVVPVVPTQTVLENYALFVTDGRITHLLPATTRRRCSQKLLLLARRNSTTMRFSQDSLMLTVMPQ